MQYFMLLHSCFGTNTSVWRSREGHGSWAGSACQVNRFRGITNSTACRGLWETTAAAFCKPLTALVSPLCLCWHMLIAGEGKGQGVRMTELLSYSPDNMLPGHALGRKWRLRPELMWWDGSTSNSHGQFTGRCKCVNKKTCGWKTLI